MNRSNVQNPKEASQIPKKRNELKDFLRTLGILVQKSKVVFEDYNCFLFINKLSYNPSFGSYPPEGHPSEAILRDLHPTPSTRLGSSSGASCIHFLRYVSDHPPAPRASISFGTSRIILRHLDLWSMKICHVGKFNFSPPISPFFFDFQELKIQKKYF